MAEGRAVPSLPPGIPDLEALGIALDPSPPQQRASQLGLPTSSSRATSATSATLLQTPSSRAAPLTSDSTQVKDERQGKKDEKDKTSLSKAASQTLKRHPVSQVFKRWGERHHGGTDRGLLSRKSLLTPQLSQLGTTLTAAEPQKGVTVRKSEPQLLPRSPAHARHPLPTFRQADECEVLDRDDGMERTAERGPSRMGKPASSMSLREAVRAAAAKLGDKEKGKTVPRRFGASPVVELEGAVGGVGREREEKKKERRMSIFKIFKGKKDKSPAA